MVKIIGYTIESTSPDGVYYLVNGWYKYFAFWIGKKDVNENKTRYLHKVTFKTIGSAKTSLKKLLKIMPDYNNDIFRLCEIRAGGNIEYIPVIKI